MIKNYKIEGFIRAKLYHSSSFLSDPDEHYFHNHSLYKFNSDDKISRLKFSEYLAEKHNITFHYAFGYNQLHVQFSVFCENVSSDIITVIETSLNRVVKGYKKFKKYFLGEICSNFHLSFAWQRLVLDFSSFFDGLSRKQKNQLNGQIINLLQQYSHDIQFLMVDEKLTDHSIRRALKIVPLARTIPTLEFDMIWVVIDLLYFFENIIYMLYISS